MHQLNQRIFTSSKAEILLRPLQDETSSQAVSSSDLLQLPLDSSCMFLTHSTHANTTWAYLVFPLWRYWQYR